MFHPSALSAQILPRRDGPAPAPAVNAEEVIRYFVVHNFVCNGECTEWYHRYFSEFPASADLAPLIDETAARIAPYAQKDPTKFYSCEEFETGVGVLREFCLLRAACSRPFDMHGQVFFFPLPKGKMFVILGLTRSRAYPPN